MELALQKVRLSEKELNQELKQIEAAKVNPERFGPLYERYYKQIFRFVFKRTEDEMLCADLVSQVFLKAMLNLKKYKYKGVPFSAWLYRIASNEVNQHFRNRKSERVVSMEKDDIERLMGDMVAEAKEDTLSGEVYQQALIQTLDGMEGEEVQIIELRYFEKRPFKEVAYIMGITENNAKVRVYRIQERLKKRLRKSLEELNEA